MQLLRVVRRAQRLHRRLVQPLDDGTGRGRRREQRVPHVHRVSGNARFGNGRDLRRAGRTLRARRCQHAKLSGIDVMLDREDAREHERNPSGDDVGDAREPCPCKARA